MPDPNYAQFVQLAQGGYNDAVDRAAKQAQVEQQQAAGRAYATGDTTTAARLLARSGDISGARQINDFGVQDQQRAQAQADRAAKITSATSYAKGDYTGAANAAAGAGDIGAVAGIQDQAAQQFTRQHAYLGQALPVLQAAQAKGQLGQAFDTLAPDLKQLGMTDEQLAAYKAAPPDQVLGAIAATVKKKWTIAKTDTGDTIAYNADNPSEHQVLAKGSGFKALGGNRFAVMDDSGQPVDTGGTGATPDVPASAPVASGPAPAAFPGVSAITSALPGATVTSAQRTPQHNAEVGGVPNSYHLTGQAVDLVPPAGMTMAQLASSAQAKFPGMRVLNEGDHVHIQPGGRAQPPAAAPSDSGDGPQIVTANGHTYRIMGGAPKAAAGGGADPASLPPPTLHPNAILQAAAKFNVTGEFPKGLPLGKAGNGDRAAIRNMAGDLADKDGKSGADLAAQGVNFGSLKAALTQETKRKYAIDRAAEDALGAGEFAVRIAQKGGGGTQFPVFNKWIQAGRQATGDTDVAEFNQRVGTFGDAYARVISGAMSNAQTPEGSRQAAHERLNKAATYGQFVKIYDTMKQEMAIARKASATTVADLQQKLAGHPGAPPQAAQPTAPAGPQPKVIRYDANGRRIP